MNYTFLTEEIKRKKTMLCIGLDTDISLIPTHLLKEKDPIFAFNKAIIDATHDVAIAYKPNIAFYESMGVKGWQALESTMEYIHSLPEKVFTIADAKRGDIGNTSKMYAKTFFDWLNFDAITVAPYMGRDSVTPFLEYENKWVILLGLTSNIGSADFQQLESQGKKLFEHVLHISQNWASHEKMMYVIGATHPEMFQEIRKIAPNHFYLVPGVGAQGGDVESVCKNGCHENGGLLINSTRQIIYASQGLVFAEKAREMALQTIQPMLKYINSSIDFN